MQWPHFIRTKEEYFAKWLEDTSEAGDAERQILGAKHYWKPNGKGPKPLFAWLSVGRAALDGVFPLVDVEPAVDWA